MTDKEIYEEAIATWGDESQFLKAAEECSELTQAILKYLNGYGDLDGVIEEVVDVTIMMEQMPLIINPDLIEKEKRKKIKRLQYLIHTGLIPESGDTDAGP